jgi:DNA polymerase III delta subunit
MPFIATKLLDQARKLSLPRVAAMHEAIFHVDRALKVSKVDDQRLMEQLVLRLCSR